MGTVTDGTLNVNIGDPSQAVTAAANAIRMVAKQTHLFEVDGTNAAATVVWQSRNLVNLGTVEASSNSAFGGTTSRTYDFSEYTGAFSTNFGGVTVNHNVIDAASLQAYNDFLVDQMQAGRLAIDDYESAFSQAYTNTLRTIEWTANAAPAGDESYLPIEDRVVIHATGANATGIMAQGAVLDAIASNDSRPGAAGYRGAVMLAENGASIINNGIVSGLRAFSGGITVMEARSGSSAENNGVVNSGFLADVQNYPEVPTGSRSGQTGIYATGSGSSLVNNGIVNSAGAGNTVALDNGASGVNDGIVNVTFGTDYMYPQDRATGVRVNNGTFTNNGVIYLGRGAQYDVANPEAVADTASGATPSAGIFAGGSASVIVNNGDIVIGSQVQNANGMRMGNASGTQTNAGRIFVNGAVAGVPAENVGMWVQNTGVSSTIVNDGEIHLNGVNGIGIKVRSTGAAPATVTSTANSIINVAGGADPSSGTRNFGVWVEGTDPGLASATIDGEINLTGVGAIGVHARGLSHVDVSATAVPNFVSGTDQIGFFIYGDQATIDIAASAMDVSTQRSTLFRIAEGADLNATGLQITASGAESIGILGTGMGTHIDAGTGEFNMTGDGSIGIVVEGGATGYIGANALMNLLGPNSTAGIADGQKHDLAGNAVGAPDATTLLTVEHNIGSSQAGVKALIARNQGTVDLTGAVTLTGAGSTGLLAQDGGTFNVDDAIVQVAGWAARAEGGTGTFNVTNSALTGTDGLFEAVNAATAVFDADASQLRGIISTSADSTNAVSLTGGTQWDVTGNSNMTSLTNDGSVINFLAAGGYKTITTQNYVGNGGTIVMNTYVNTDGDPSDVLVIDGGTATGSTLLDIRNTGGPGNYTLNGVKVVNAINGGTTEATAFTLYAPVIAGLFEYTLERGPYQAGSDAYGDSENADDWYLRSELEPEPTEPTEPTVPTEPTEPTEPTVPTEPTEPTEPTIPTEPTVPTEPVEPTDPPEVYQPGAPVYEAYPQVLLALNELPTLQQRVGNRYWRMVREPEPVFCKDAAQNFKCTPTNEQGAYYADGKPVIEGGAIWGRIEGSHRSYEPAFSTTGTDYDVDLFKLQAGLDFQLHEAADGSMLIGGVTVHYGHASADVSSRFSTGKISTDGYGVGGTLTWYGANGFYVDGQAQYSWYDSDLSSDQRGWLVRGNDGEGYALSLEAGKRIDLNDGWTVTPQAQIVYSSVSFDSFTQVYRGAEVARISLDDGDSLRGRLGLSLDRQSSWTAEDGTVSRSHVYGLANLYYEFLDGTVVDGSGMKVVSRRDDLWGGVGIGGTWNWNDDKYSIYGEGSVNTSLENFGDSYELKGTVGLRVKW